MDEWTTSLGKNLRNSALTTVWLHSGHYCTVLTESTVSSNRENQGGLLKLWAQAIILYRDPLQFANVG